MGGDKSVIDAGIHGLKSSLDSAIGGGGDKSVQVPLHTKALHLDRLSSEALHLAHSLGQPFRVWLGGWGVTKASLMLGTRVGSMDLNHHLAQPLRVWLGVGGDKSVQVPLHTKALHLDRLSSEALHLEHSLGQPFRVWLEGWGVTKASLMLGTRVGSMHLNHHLTQPLRVWLGG